MGSPLIKGVDEKGARARENRRFVKGRVTAVYPASNTAATDVGVIDRITGITVPFIVPYTPTSPPQVGDVVPFDYSGTSNHSVRIGIGRLGGQNSPGSQTVNASNVGLEVKEVDGAPDVTGVVQIKVPNGSLTDNTGGSVSLSMPVFVGDSGSGGVKGEVPAPAAGDAAAGKFLKADGTFEVPPGSGGVPNYVGFHAYNSATQTVLGNVDNNIGFDSERTDTNAFHFSSAAALTGTVTKTNGSTTVTGSGTAFTTELSINQVFTIPGGGGTDTVVVTAIASNISLTVAVAPLRTASGQTATRVNYAVAIPAGQDGKYRPTLQLAMTARLVNSGGTEPNAQIRIQTGTDIGTTLVVAIVLFVDSEYLSLTAPDVDMAAGDIFYCTVYPGTTNKTINNSARYSCEFSAQFLGA